MVPVAESKVTILLLVLPRLSQTLRARPCVPQGVLGKLQRTSCLCYLSYRCLLSTLLSTLSTHSTLLSLLFLLFLRSGGVVFARHARRVLHLGPQEAGSDRMDLKHRDIICLLIKTWVDCPYLGVVIGHQSIYP